jgi:hypothetical protein
MKVNALRLAGQSAHDAYGQQGFCSLYDDGRAARRYSFDGGRDRNILFLPDLYEDVAATILDLEFPAERKVCAHALIRLGGDS